MKGKPLPPFSHPKYAPKDQHGHAVRVFLDSKTWTPSRPGEMVFDAQIEKCSDPDLVTIGHRKLSSFDFQDWLVGAYDVFAINGDVTLELITILDPAVNVEEFAKAEGVRVEEL